MVDMCSPFGQVPSCRGPVEEVNFGCDCCSIGVCCIMGHEYIDSGGVHECV